MLMVMLGLEERECPYYCAEKRVDRKKVEGSDGKAYVAASWQVKDY